MSLGEQRSHAGNCFGSAVCFGKLLGSSPDMWFCRQVATFERLCLEQFDGRTETKQVDSSSATGSGGWN